MLFVGLISGTSVDGIDAALVRFDHPSTDPGLDHPALVAHYHYPYDPTLRRDLLALCHAEAPALHHLYTVDALVGEAFATAVTTLLDKANTDPGKVQAIGSHGQTIRHYPRGPTPYTVQIGDPNIIAERTGITTIADLRRRDVAAGGQGAPLAPVFHAEVLRHPTYPRAVVNIGGIANVTFLDPSEDEVQAFDTGPGNGLMDAWIRQCEGLPFDGEGQWARRGQVDAAALDILREDEYFTRAAPKSTGPEYFNLEWVGQRLPELTALEPTTVQRTLCELTAVTIAQAIQTHTSAVREVLVCGGGVHNRLLMERLAARCASRQHPATVESTAIAGVDPDWMEAMAFAWLARRTLAGQAGNIPSVTGARRSVALGAIYPGALARDNAEPPRSGP